MLKILILTITLSYTGAQSTAKDPKKCFNLPFSTNEPNVVYDGIPLFSSNSIELGRGIDAERYDTTLEIRRRTVCEKTTILSRGNPSSRSFIGIFHGSSEPIEIGETTLVRISSGDDFYVTLSNGDKAALIGPDFAVLLSFLSSMSHIYKNARLVRSGESCVSSDGDLDTVVSFITSGSSTTTYLTASGERRNHKPSVGVSILSSRNSLTVVSGQSVSRFGICWYNRRKSPMLYFGVSMSLFRISPSFRIDNALSNGERITLTRVIITESMTDIKLDGDFTDIFTDKLNPIRSYLLRKCNCDDHFEPPVVTSSDNRILTGFVCGAFIPNDAAREPVQIGPYMRTKPLEVVNPAFYTNGTTPRRIARSIYTHQGQTESLDHRSGRYKRSFSGWGYQVCALFCFGIGIQDMGAKVSSAISEVFNDVIDKINQRDGRLLGFINNNKNKLNEVIETFNQFRINNLQAIDEIWDQIGVLEDKVAELIDPIEENRKSIIELEARDIAQEITNQVVFANLNALTDGEQGFYEPHYERDLAGCIKEKGLEVITIKKVNATDKRLFAKFKNRTVELATLDNEYVMSAIEHIRKEDIPIENSRGPFEFMGDVAFGVVVFCIIAGVIFLCMKLRVCSSLSAGFSGPSKGKDVPLNNLILEGGKMIIPPKNTHRQEKAANYTPSRTNPTYEHDPETDEFFNISLPASQRV